MRYLALAFAGEGPTDHQFVAPLAARYTEHLVLAHSDEEVQIGPVIPVLPGGKWTNQADTVVGPFSTGDIYADILFIHTDAGTGVSKAVKERVDPVRIALEDVHPSPEVVGVVPDRETEAWMLADVGAIERLVGMRHGLLSGPEPPSRVHRILDPKAALVGVVDEVDSTTSRRARSHRHAQRIERLYSGLASEVSFEELLRVPSFRRFDKDLRSTLNKIGLIGE